MNTAIRSAGEAVSVLGVIEPSRVLTLMGLDASVEILDAIANGSIAVLGNGRLVVI